MRARQCSSVPVLVAAVALAGLLVGCAQRVEPASAASLQAATSLAAVPAGLPPTVPAGLPPGVPEPPPATGQLVTVLAPSSAATTATMRVWERSAGGWREMRAAQRVRVGTDGVGVASERSRRTPAGSFGLHEAFGRSPDPGTRLPYRRVSDQDWWVSDPHSPAYNTYQHCRPGGCPFDESAGENLWRAGPSYDHALVIGYNTTRPVSGAGSAFFVHVDAGVPSTGCVVASRTAVVELLRWLDPDRRPRITIGVG